MPLRHCVTMALQMGRPVAQFMEDFHRLGMISITLWVDYLKHVVSSILSNLSYCWWKKSCTICHISNPVNNGMFTNWCRISSINSKSLYQRYILRHGTGPWFTSLIFSFLAYKLLKDAPNQPNTYLQQSNAGTSQSSRPMGPSQSFDTQLITNVPCLINSSKSPLRSKVKRNLYEYVFRFFSRLKYVQWILGVLFETFPFWKHAHCFWSIKSNSPFKKQASSASHQ